MNLKQLVIGLLLSGIHAVAAENKSRTLKGDKGAAKQQKSTKSKSSKVDIASTTCTRKVWSVMNKNATWSDAHVWNEQVWYHTLDDVHGLWKEGYFDYVLDIRPLQDTTMSTGMLLEGWETLHIPGSYPINVFPADTPASEITMLVDFASSNVCKDSRIFVHCWSGLAGNRVSQSLIELGFTNVHAAGPASNAGMWQWKDAGYDVVYDDTFDPVSMQPDCIRACNV